MEMAIDVMRQSVSEPRDDGKASPKVGAVLVKPDGTVETACRGELRHGDHAEFTILERKNRGNRLDGSILFATLEPCAPGARRHPKLGCAERIGLARIKEVWTFNRIRGDLGRIRVASMGSCGHKTGQNVRVKPIRGARQGYPDIYPDIMSG
jgi:pyrimidine deaminase RibD-like protein